MIRRLLIWLRLKYFDGKHRHVDPEICCCGCIMGDGGSICYHGGCRSMLEYARTSYEQDLNK